MPQCRNAAMPQCRTTALPQDLGFRNVLGTRLRPRTFVLLYKTYINQWFRLPKRDFGFRDTLGTCLRLITSVLLYKTYINQWFRFPKRDFGFRDTLGTRLRPRTSFAAQDLCFSMQNLYKSVVSAPEPRFRLPRHSRTLVRYGFDARG